MRALIGGSTASDPLPSWNEGAVREWAYDRTSSIGRLDEAKARGWTVASMKGDWKRIFPFE